MKPREFWIEVDPAGEGIHHAYTSPDAWQINESNPAIHVREVLPIDWEKVWAIHDEVIYSGREESKQRIQELVERSLRGELE